MAKAIYLLLLVSLAYCLADVQAGGVASENLLFDQFGSPLGVGVLSQQFADVDNLRFLAADDFAVPDGQSWRIERIAIRGIFQTEKEPGEENGAIWNIRIYASGAGKLTELAPADAPLFEALGLTADLNEAADSDAFGQINFTLAEPPVLTAGRYWLSVFPTKSGRAFYWEVTDTRNLEPFLINQDSGLDICSSVTTVEGTRWTLPFRCPEAFFFEDGRNDTSGADLNEFNALVFRLEGTVSRGGVATTGGVDTTGVVLTTGGTGVLITTGDGSVVVTTGDGGVVITTGDTGVQITGDGIVVTGDGDVGSVDFASSANTLSAFWFF